MAEDNPSKDEAAPHPPDVIDKIDELLHRHRSKSPAGDVIPVLGTAQGQEGTVADGIPVLTDVVAGPAQDAKSPPAPYQAINSLLIVRRMALALDAEHARLSAEIGGDIHQLRVLDRLVAELKHALPAAVRAAIMDRAT
jgi:hypothetical protein